ncbi:hypothetical protein [Swingsia samuiensis]|uniref:Uncharacterized protein n=1 Tax=Swingsia samuiensis TaxID=1293412 RepID=A0A4Y6UKR8_9PROT|nr:hypothetical protein [Swingsia samuiensis]QDH17390.1 hypothetical protein E3D00_07305 [Swingsia samuiensis]
MSGTLNATAASGGKSVSALETTEKISHSDLVLGVFNGGVQNTTVKALVAAGMPSNLVFTDHLDQSIKASLDKAGLPNVIAQANDISDTVKTRALQADNSKQAASISEQNAAQSAAQSLNAANQAIDKVNKASITVSGVVDAQKDAANGIAALSADKHLMLSGVSVMGISPDGHLLLSIDLPTQDPHVAGVLWNNGQYVMISAG